MQISLKKMSLPFSKKRKRDNDTDVTMTANEILKTVTMTPSSTKAPITDDIVKVTHDNKASDNVTPPMTVTHGFDLHDVMSTIMSNSVIPQSVMSSNVTAGQKMTPVTFWQHVIVKTHYTVTFKWVIAIATVIVDIGSNIAVSAFILSTIYVTLNTVAHRLVTWVLPWPDVITTLNQLAIIAFSVLPELVALAAIAVTWRHWKMFFATKRLQSLGWAIAFTIPTAIFLAMTVLTIGSFVSLEAISNTSPQATGLMLVTRCFAGWFYSLISMLYAKVGVESDAEMWIDLNSKAKKYAGVIVQQAEALNQHIEKVTQQQQALIKMTHELDELKLELSLSSMASRQVTMTPKTAVTHKRVTVTQKPATKNVTHDSQATKNVTSQNVTHDSRATESVIEVPVDHDSGVMVATVEDGGDNSNASDNDSSQSVTDDNPISKSVMNAIKREKLKDLMRDNIDHQKGKTLVTLAKEAGMSYGTARNNSNVIIEELKKERSL